MKAAGLFLAGLADRTTGSDTSNHAKLQGMLLHTTGSAGIGKYVCTCSFVCATA